MKRFSLLALLMVFSMSVVAQVNKAKAEFYFSQSNDRIDPSVNGNAHQLYVLDSIAADFSKVAIPNRYLIIHSYTSPDGSVMINEQVARRRAEVVEKLFDSKLVTDAHVIYRPHYFEWGDVVSMIEQDSDLPNKEAVLLAVRQIKESSGFLDNAEASEQLVRKLKSIDNGSSYTYMAKNYFLKLHKVVLEARYLHGSYISVAPEPEPIVEVGDAAKVQKPVIVIEEPAVEVEEPVKVEEPAIEVEEPVKVEEPAVEVEEPVKVEEPAVEVEEPVIPDSLPVLERRPEPSVPVDTVSVVEQPSLADSQIIDTTEVLQQNLPKNQESIGVFREVQRPVTKGRFWTNLAQNLALKTNLLYDVALVPNLAIEWAVTDHFSLNADWMYAWWSRDSKHDYWRVYGGDVEFRYWLANRNDRKFTGHHIGIYAGMLTYDIEWGGTGYMGEKWSHMFGVSYGYALPLSKRLNLDFELGIGYFGGEYYEYEPEFGSYIWQQTKKRKWFGPTRAEVSLVWLLGGNNK